MEVDIRQLIALASAVIHVDEARAAGGHHWDWIAFDAMVENAKPLLAELEKSALIPLRRDGVKYSDEDNDR